MASSSLLVRLSTVALFFLALWPAASVRAAGLVIPEGHPRLWYSTQSGTPGAARLARARAYAASNPVPVNNGDVPSGHRDRVLRGLLSGNAAASCIDAVAWLRGYSFPSQNEARWSGEQAILVYDWCYPHMSSADRTTITDNWNTRLAYWNNQSWGGVTMAASNYYWGFLRNSLLWGIASYHHNPQAQSFIDHALDVRVRSLANPPPAGSSRFQAWYEAFGVGGVPLEGSAYGGPMVYYPAVAFTAATDYGYDAWNVVPFHRDVLYYLHYASPPQPTQLRDNAVARYEFFPFNEDENFRVGGTAENDAYGDFIGAYALRNPSARASRLASNWMSQRGIVPSWWVRSELASASITTSVPTLPLDYYADGTQFLYGSSGTAAGATRFMFQLGSSGDGVQGGGVGHIHRDLGNFQIWRKGRWITRETTGYVNSIPGWNNGAAVDVAEAVAHNTVLFQGRGQIGSRRGWATVKRLQSDAAFTYAAVDMTESYRAPAVQPWDARRDWPFAEVAIREFVYLRELEALVVLDRVKSGSDSLDPVYNSEYTGPRMAGSQVSKTFVLHATGTGSSGTGNPFTLGNATATANVGTQRMDLRTLLPASPSYRVVSEGGPVGQFRIEYDVSGTEMSYLLNVVSARDASEAAVSVSMNDLGDSWQLQLSRPGKGSATVVLRKGEASTGGSVRIGSGSTQPMRQDVQGMLLASEGPVWTGGGTAGTPAISTGGNQRAVALPGASSAGQGAQALPAQAPAQSVAIVPAAAADADQDGTLRAVTARLVRIHFTLQDAWRRSMEWLAAFALAWQAPVAPAAEEPVSVAGSRSVTSYSPSHRSTELHQATIRSQLDSQNER